MASEQISNAQISKIIQMRLDKKDLSEIVGETKLPIETVLEWLPVPLKPEYIKNSRIDSVISKVVYPNIRRELIECNLSFTYFSKMAGMSNATLINALTGKAAPVKTTIDKILSVLSMTYEEAFATEEIGNE